MVAGAVSVFECYCRTDSVLGWLFLVRDERVQANQGEMMPSCTYKILLFQGGTWGILRTGDGDGYEAWNATLKRYPDHSLRLEVTPL